MFVGCDNDLKMTWLDSRGPNRRSSGLFFFAGNGGLNCRRAVSAKTQQQQQKKTKLRQHLKKQPSALKSGRIALFCFFKKNVTFCVPRAVFFCSGGERTVTYLASQSACVTLGDKGHCGKTCVRFNLEFACDFDQRIKKKCMRREREREREREKATMEKQQNT